MVACPRPAWARLIVDRIVVHGPTKTTARVIAARMGLRPGDGVDFAMIANAERRLAQSGLFSAARVYLNLPKATAAQLMYVDAADYPVAVHVEVTEKHSWIVAPLASFGGGDYAAGLAYGDHNLLGHGGQAFAAGQLGQLRSFVAAGYRDPLLVGTSLTWGMNALYRAEHIRFFSDHRPVLKVPTLLRGAEAEVGWVLSSHLRALVGFSARWQRVDSPEILDTSVRLPLYNSREGRVFLVTFKIRYDNTVSPGGLRRGVILQLKNDVSDQYWGSQFDYFKFEGRTELYGKVAWNYPSLVTQVVFNFPTSGRGVPLTQMLRIGGPTLRGHFVNEFHGDTLVSAQLENQIVVLRGLPLPFVKTRFKVAAAGFFDVAALLERHPGGTAIDPPVRSKFELGNLHTGVGAGLRMVLPGVAIPAIKVDLGYGIDVRSFAVTLSIGYTT